MNEILISVCIPVYNTEAFLFDCLQSVKDQDLDCIEVLILSDASTGRNQKGWKAKKIVKSFAKSVSFPVKFLENNHNQGLVEVRRSLAYAASGKYIFNLDSDDLLAPGSLKALLQAAQSGDYDIVHGLAKDFDDIENNQIVFSKKESRNINYPGELNSPDILDGFLVRSNQSSFLWSKLFKRQLLLDAFELIPFTYCNMAEDTLIYFFSCYLAKKYLGIESIIYYYRVNAGMTSKKKITSLEQCSKVCSSASVFSIIYSWRNELIASSGKDPLTENQLKAIQTKALLFLQNNLLQLKKTTDEDFYPQAYELLCEYWGESFVKKVEKLDNPDFSS